MCVRACVYVCVCGREGARDGSMVVRMRTAFDWYGCVRRVDMGARPRVETASKALRVTCRESTLWMPSFFCNYGDRRAEVRGLAKGGMQAGCRGLSSAQSQAFRSTSARLSASWSRCLCCGEFWGRERGRGRDASNLVGLQGSRELLDKAPSPASPMLLPQPCARVTCRCNCSRTSCASDNHM